MNKNKRREKLLNDWKEIQEYYGGRRVDLPTEEENLVNRDLSLQEMIFKNLLNNVDYKLVDGDIRPVLKTGVFETTMKALKAVETYNKITHE